jgi:hypothetical protein
VAKDWKGLGNRVVSHLGLRTKLLGFKFFKHADRDVEFENGHVLLIWTRFRSFSVYRDGYQTCFALTDRGRTHGAA